MRYYLDENFPVVAKAVLEGTGSEVFRAIDRHPHGTSDSVLLADAQSLGAVFLTTDRDFFHREAALRPVLEASIVVIALHRPSSSNILKRLWDLMDVVDLSTAPAAAYLVTDTRVIRR